MDKNEKLIALVEQTGDYLAAVPYDDESEYSGAIRDALHNLSQIRQVLANSKPTENEIVEVLNLIMEHTVAEVRATGYFDGYNYDWVEYYDDDESFRKLAREALGIPEPETLKDL